MKMDRKVALITGGARIGAAVAQALARRGCKVALTHRSSAAAAQATARRIRAAGGQAMTLPADLARPMDADRTVEAVAKAWGGVDILVHLASVYGRTPMTALEKDPGALSDGPGAVDLGAAYRLALRCAPHMRRRGTGRIILFSDWTAASGRPRYKDFAPYYAAKAGAKALTEALALELAPAILVNAVAPGPILPPPDLKKGVVEDVKRSTPLGRWGGPEEIVKAVLFFVESDFVTGETLRVDGGRHLS